MISGRNFSGQPGPDVGGETEFSRCNFTQPAPVDSGGGIMRGVRLWTGDDTPRTFTDCNLVNCEPPPGSTLTGCNTTVRENHVIASTDQVIIDGVPVDVPVYVSRIHGRIDQATGDYVDHPSPIDVPSDGPIPEPE